MAEEDISKILAVINPDKYYDGDKIKIKEFKDIIKKEGFEKAFEKAKAKSSEEHTITYDSSSETLEPLYFWIIDFMNSRFKGDVVKLIDNFSSSPGGGHFAEIGMRATRMQEEAMKVMQTAGVLTKSIINLIYDLKEFEILIQQYNDCHSKDKEKAIAAVLGLKQRWMDNVDIKRGAASINMLARDLQFITIRDAFMAADSLENVDKLDLNDRVKRILKPRIAEFFEWKERSEKEIKKRYEIEKTYLKSQVNALQLYSRWAKPYLKAASQLEMKDFGRNPALVNVFNTILLELTVLGKNKFDAESAVLTKDLPKAAKNAKREYYSCVLVNFKFRGIPRKIEQHYVFGGRAEITFRAYSLNKDEIDLLEEQLKKSDLNDALNLVESSTTESLSQLKEDIDSYLKDEKKVEKKESSSDANPFLALFGFYSKSSKKEEDKGESKAEKLKKEGVSKDSYIESLIRALAETSAIEECFSIFDIFKKSQGMASHPNPHEYWIPPEK